MKKTLLFIGGAGVLGYSLYRYFKIQSTLLQGYEYKIAGIKVRSFKFNDLALDVDIKFTSKADIEAKINKVYLTLFLEDKEVGFVKEVKEFIIPARGSSIVPIFISINPQYVLKNLTDIVLGIGRSKDVRFRMEGYASIQSGFVRTTLPIKYQTTLKQYFGK
jgi:hypothetical protein